MFTGIVESLGKVIRVEAKSGGAHLYIRSELPPIGVGQSVAVDGVCLTALETFDPTELKFFIGEETFKRTHLRDLHKSSLVNLERALSVNSQLSGHLVQGHVDGVAEVIDLKREPSGSALLTAKLSRTLGRYMIEKGSITLNGVSLTLTSVLDEGDFTRFKIMLIPHTLSETNLQFLKPKDRINVEVDLIAKYAERLCQPYSTQSKR